MYKCIKIIIFCLIISPVIASAYDGSTHMYAALLTPEIWEDFDPDFYDSLIVAQNNWDYYQPDIRRLQLVKFYYIGVWMPDMLWPGTQDRIRDLIETLKSVGGLNDPLKIEESTYNLVQDEIKYGFSDNSHNLEKSWEMIKYARDQNSMRICSSNEQISKVNRSIRGNYYDQK